LQVARHVFSRSVNDIIGQLMSELEKNQKKLQNPGEHPLQSEIFRPYSANLGKKIPGGPKIFWWGGYCDVLRSQSQNSLQKCSSVATLYNNTHLL